MALEQETSFGLWLRQRRKALDLTQWDLAERIGCSGSTIQKIEDGVRRPSRQVAELLATVLDIAPAERDAFLRWARVGIAGDGDGLRTTDDGRRTTDEPHPTPNTQHLTPDTPAPANLPAPLTPLIGRENELERLRSYISRPDVRLLTLTGPPGIGKTRLAIQLAAQSAALFDGGIYFAPLAVVTDPEQVVPAIAQTLGVQSSPGSSCAEAISAIAQRAGEKRTLLVLDNFEQVLDAMPYIFDLLSACPLLTLVITSREALRAPGEWRFPVPPLEVPSITSFVLDYRAPGSSRSLGTRYSLLGTVPSVALFVQRAQAVRPDFGLTEENAEDVAAICTRLDGLPLAIELAAARIGLLTPAEIRRRLDSRLRLLKGGSMHLPARQRTLRGALDWSYDLLTPSEQRLFRRLAVFSGGFSLQGAGQVCGTQLMVAGSGLRVDEDQPSTIDSQLSTRDQAFDVLDGVASLVNKSLVTRMETEGQGVWLGMLETIREYALERLEESGEVEEIRRRHLAYYVDLVEVAAPEMLRGRKQESWLFRLERNFTNLSAAVQWAGSCGDLESVGRIAGSLWRFWYVRGHLNEARQWLELALSHKERLSRPTLAITTQSMGVVVDNQGDYAQGYSYLQEALELLKEVGNRDGVASALTNLAVVAHDRGDFAQARAYLEESLAVQSEIGNRRGLGICLVNLGVIAAIQGDPEATRHFYEESLAVFRELDDSQGMGTALNNLGSTAFDEGRYSAAKEFFEEALQIRRRLDSHQGIASTLRSLADLAVERGDCVTARELAGESLVLYSELGHKHGIADALLTLGRAALAGCDLAQARANLEESLRTYNALGSTADVAFCLDAMAGLLIKENPPDPDKAAKLYAAADSLRKGIGFSLWPHPRTLRDRSVAAACKMLDAALFTTIWDEGQVMTIDQAVACALDETV